MDFEYISLTINKLKIKMFLIYDHHSTYMYADTPRAENIVDTVKINENVLNFEQKAQTA